MNESIYPIIWFSSMTSPHQFPHIQRITFRTCRSSILPVRYNIFWPDFVQVRSDFASVSLDDHMSRVVDVCFTAGHVIFAVAA